MAVKQYIGARYVPKFFDANDSVWSAGTTYEALTIVIRNGNLYISKKPVPASVDAPENSPAYWANIGVYNANVQAINEALDQLNEEIDDMDAAYKAADAVLTANLESSVTELHATDTALENLIESLRAAVGSPLEASTAAQMTNTDKIYVYTGSESGYTYGNWYYYNGTTWVSGGQYNSAAIVTDTTLTERGKAADAYTVGQAIDTINAKTFIFRRSLQSSEDVDALTTAGQYYLTDDQLALGAPAHYPSDAVGRLLVFGDATDSRILRAQIVIDVRNRLYYRIGRSSGWTDWVLIQTGIMPYGTVTAEGDFADLDTFPINSLALIPSGTRSNFSNYPELFHTGAMITTINGTTNAYNGTTQTAYFYASGCTAERRYINNAWLPWQYDGVRYERYHCEMQSGTGVNFTNLAWGLRYMMQNATKWNEHYRSIITVGEGTFPLTNAVGYITGGSLDSRGLFIPPYVEIHGAGKDKTILTMYNTNTDDAIMTRVSGLNMPYNSSISDLTISVRNVRYAIHSDNGMEDMPDVIMDNTTLRNNVEINVENVKIEHLGFDEGLTPSYNVPSAWGGCIRNNNTLNFHNCEFIAAQYGPLLIHNLQTNSSPTKVNFDNCRFINKRQEAFIVHGRYASLFFITWGSNVRNPIVLKNCYANRFLMILTDTTNGSPNSTCDYSIYLDNGMPVIEQTTNGLNMLDNFISDNCMVAYADGAITGYTPVSGDLTGSVRTYNAADMVHGIALNSADDQGPVTWQYKGLVYYKRLTTSNFSAGDLVGYVNGQWVVDSTNPILKIINAGMAEIIND